MKYVKKNIKPGRKGMSLEKFIELSKKAHGDEYDYSLVNYKNTRDKVVIICPKHGQFEVQAHDHMKGYGCSRCGPEASFLKRANKIYKDKFDYSKMIYTRMCDTIEIVCPVHGSFFIAPASHLMGTGCRKCNNNKKASEN